jgi:DNA-binding response OmpR family regulator
MRRILIVEDEPVLRETYQIILSTQPYICDVATDGKMALDMCAKTDYDLILLDLMMPIMSGVEFLENYDKLDEMKSRIIILSNLSSGTELDRAYDLGVQKNLVKSDLSPKDLIHAIRYDLEINS